jgi:putative endonuclease
MNDRRKETGDHGEKLAENFLARKGYKIIRRKYVCFLGEIDLIAEKDKSLVFIEVKTRKSLNFDPLDSITAKKRQKLADIARYFEQKLKKPRPIWFDVVCIKESAQGDADIEHIENAFSLI